MPTPTSLAPGYIRLTYSGVLFPHHMTIPINFDGTPTPGEQPNLILKDLSVVPMNTAMTAFVNVLKPFYAAATHFGLMEAHAVDPVTGADQFIFSDDIDQIGTSLGTANPCVQVVLTYKLRTGGLYRLFMMEAEAAANVKAFPPMSETRVANLNTYITGDTSLIYGRTNQYPFTVVSYVSKFNDKLRKQQGLS